MVFFPSALGATRSLLHFVKTLFIHCREHDHGRVSASSASIMALLRPELRAASCNAWMAPMPSWMYRFTSSYLSHKQARNHYQHHSNCASGWRKLTSFYP